MILMVVQLAYIEIDNAFWTFVGICLSVGSFAIYCIIKNAYFGYNQPPKGINFLLFVIMPMCPDSFKGLKSRVDGFFPCDIDLRAEHMIQGILTR